MMIAACRRFADYVVEYYIDRDDDRRRMTFLLVSGHKDRI